MSVIIRLQNLPLTANSIDIRTFFRGLSIPDGGVHIVGGREGDAFIAFSTDEDARQAMQLTGSNLQGSPVRLLLSSRNEMFKVIEQARQKTLGIAPNTPNTGISDSPPSNTPTSAPRESNNPAIATSSFQNHSTHTLQSSNTSNSNLSDSSLGSQTGLASSTNAFGIPNMSAFTGLINMNNGNVPQQQGISHFGTMSNTSQITPQISSILGHPQAQGNLNSSIFSRSAPNTPHGIAHNNQNQFGSMGSPFGSGISPLMNTNSNTQVPLAFPSGLMTNGPPPSMTGHGQQQTGLTGHQMHMMGGNGHGGSLGLPNQNQMINPGIQNTGNSGGGVGGAGGFNMSGPRIGGMGFMNNNSMHGPTGSNPFISQGAGLALGQHSTAATNSGISGSFGPGNSGMETGSGGGRGRPSRFQQIETNSEESVPGNNNVSQGRGRFNISKEVTRPNRQGFGTFGKPDATAPTSRDRDRDQFSRDRGDRNSKRSRSRSRDRRDSRRSGGGRGDRERSRDGTGRDRDNRRHCRTKSKSRSRSRDRDRSARTIGNSRRNSSMEGRDKLSSPDKNKMEDDSKNSSGNDDVLIISEGTEEEFPCIKVMGLPRDVSSREVKDFFRVDFRGGTDGIVRNYDEGIAFIRLDKICDFQKAYRQNCRKIGNSLIRVEGILLEAWDSAYNTLKRQAAPDRDHEKDVDRDRSRGRDNERETHRDRDNRDPRDKDFRVRDYDRTCDRDKSSTTNTECCLLIRGLPPAFSAKDVGIRTLAGVRKWVFSEIVILQAQGDNGRPVANAYVQIMSMQEAQKIIDHISRTEDGASLRTQILSIDELAHAKKAGGISQQSGYTKDKDSRFGSGETKSLFDLDIGLDSGSSSVILRGVPPNMSERDIVDFFSDIGLTPMNVQMTLDINGSRNGQVICEFQDTNRARRATTKDGMAFGRSTISVQLVPSRGNTGNAADIMISSEISGSLSGHPRGLRGPGILGIRPPRFPNPLHRSPNPFVQAMQQGMRPPRGGPRVRGGFTGRGGPRMGTIRPSTETTTGEGCVLALTNVPYSASMDDILRFLESTLDMEVNRDRIIRRYNEFQQATGDARIAFDTPFDAKRAHDLLQGSTMWNRKVEASLPSEF